MLSALESDRIQLRRPCAVFQYAKAAGPDVLWRSAAEGMADRHQREPYRLGQDFRGIAGPPGQTQHGRVAAQVQAIFASASFDARY